MICINFIGSKTVLIDLVACFPIKKGEGECLILMESPGFLAFNTTGKLLLAVYMEVNIIAISYKKNIHFLL